MYQTEKCQFSFCNPRKCKHSVATCVMYHRNVALSIWHLARFWPADTSIIRLPALKPVGRYLQPKRAIIPWVFPPSASPVIIGCWYTPHCLPVGAAAGQSLSHLITALKAQSNNIIALSVTDDWDLQRAWSASVPVHLTGQGCRLIKGLLNMVAQQPRLS